MISVLTFDLSSDASSAHTDASAIEAWLNDADEAAASWLFEKYLPLVRHICSRRFSRGWMSEDATQDTMSRAFLSLSHFDTTRCFSSWIAAIAGNVCADRARSLARRPEVSTEELGTPLPEWMENMVGEGRTAERVEIAHALVSTLPPEVRTVVELHYFEGLTSRKVAERTGLSAANVAIRLMRARQTLATRAAAFC